MNSTGLLEYYQNVKCKKTRVCNRASCHVLSKAELMAVTGVYLDNPNFGTSFNEQARNHTILYLQARGDQLKRGDIIILGPDVGFRNSGFYIFDGTNILDLSALPDPYGSIPQTFQTVGEFSPLYWSDLVEHNSYVPFDFGYWLKNTKVDNVKLMPVKGGFHLSFPFQGNDNQYYTIVDRAVYPTTLTAEDVSNLASSFYQTLSASKYFSYYTPSLYPTLPGNLKPETTLVSV